MPDYVVVDGDTVEFESSFGSATVVVAPGKITGSGSKLKVSGKAVCIEGDESSAQVSGCAYTTLTYTVSGLGTFTIDSLGSDQKAQKLIIDGKKAIRVGSKFNAKFAVETPAKTPPPPSTPDSTLEYSGSGSFVTDNNLLKSD
jgi:hypothetical protein